MLDPTVLFASVIKTPDKSFGRMVFNHLKTFSENESSRCWPSTSKTLMLLLKKNKKKTCFSRVFSVWSSGLSDCSNTQLFQKKYFFLHLLWYWCLVVMITRVERASSFRPSSSSVPVTSHSLHPSPVSAEVNAVSCAQLRAALVLSSQDGCWLLLSSTWWLGSLGICWTLQPCLTYDDWS